MLNLFIFSDIKKADVVWLGDEYQNFLILIALLIAGDEGWTTSL